MKLKYSYRNVDILYRNEKKKKKVQKTKKNSFKKIFTKTAVSVFTAAVLVMILIIGASKSGMFNVSKINVVVTNEKTSIDSSMFSSLIGKNIFNIKNSDVKNIINKRMDFMGVRYVTKFYPARVNIILYRKVPIININGEYVLYQDCTAGKMTNAEIANTLYMQSDIRTINSAFDIPGLATIFEWILRHRNSIKNIKYSNGEFYVRLNGKYAIMAKAGKDINSKVTEYNINKSVVDLRFDDMVLVKN